MAPGGTLSHCIEGFQKRAFVQAKGHSLFEVESTVFLSPNNVLTREAALLPA